MSQKIIQINATNLPDLWYQTLYAAVEHGRDFTINQGSFAGQVRKEFDFVILHAACPGKGELLPKLNPALNIDDPVAEGYLDDYLPYLMTANTNEQEAYTYGQRICEALLLPEQIKYINPHNEKILIKDQEIWDNGVICKTKQSEYLLNQLELLIWTYRSKGHRTNQMILQISQPTDMMLQDPPCLRHIDTRIQDDKLHFYPYFRSWDLWGGLPANLAGIELMKQYCAAEIGVGNGEIIATSKGLHLYEYVFPLMELVRGKTTAEFKQHLTDNITV